MLPNALTAPVTLSTSDAVTSTSDSHASSSREVGMEGRTGGAVRVTSGRGPTLSSSTTSDISRPDSSTTCESRSLAEDSYTDGSNSTSSWYSQLSDGVKVKEEGHSDGGGNPAKDALFLVEHRFDELSAVSSSPLDLPFRLKELIVHFYGPASVVLPWLGCENLDNAAKYQTVYERYRAMAFVVKWKQLMRSWQLETGNGADVSTFLSGGKTPSVISLKGKGWAGELFGLGLSMMCSGAFKKLDFSESDITSSEVEALTKVLRDNTTVESLCLPGAALGDKGKNHVADMVEHNTGLKQLEVIGTGMMPASANALCQALCKNTTLGKVAMQVDGEAKDWMDTLVDGIKGGFSITVLELVSITFSGEEVEKIQDAIGSTTNKKLRRLDVRKSTLTKRLSDTKQVRINQPTT